MRTSKIQTYTLWKSNSKPRDTSRHPQEVCIQSSQPVPKHPSEPVRPQSAHEFDFQIESTPAAPPAAGFPSLTRGPKVPAMAR